MPGGQFTNLQEQARAVGLMHRWPEICQTYAAVNQLLGDIVKVTPTSKSVGDLALFLVTNNLNAEAILDPTREMSFPESVVDLLAGRMGQPPGGFPPQVRDRVLRGQKPVEGRPGESLPPANFAETAEKLKKILGRDPEEHDVITYLLYPRVFQDFAAHQTAYADVSVLPTPYFLYGQQMGEELAVDIERGKTLILKLLTIGEPHPDGGRTVFFELNGQPRSVTVIDRSLQTDVARRPKADPNDPRQVAAPMPGLVVNVAVKIGDTVKRGQKLLSLEAMKMETTLYAEQDGRIADVLVKAGSPVEAGELVVSFE
jgi:pyruvate carboxylase